MAFANSHQILTLPSPWLVPLDCTCGNASENPISLSVVLMFILAGGKVPPQKITRACSLTAPHNARHKITQGKKYKHAVSAPSLDQLQSLI
jgi:hypothetical protein